MYRQEVIPRVGKLRCSAQSLVSLQLILWLKDIKDASEVDAEEVQYWPQGRVMLVCVLLFSAASPLVLSVLFAEKYSYGLRYPPSFHSNNKDGRLQLSLGFSTATQTFIWVHSSCSVPHMCLWNLFALWSIFEDCTYSTVDYTQGQKNHI